MMVRNYDRTKATTSKVYALKSETNDLLNELFSNDDSRILKPDHIQRLKAACKVSKNDELGSQIMLRE